MQSAKHMMTNIIGWEQENERDIFKGQVGTQIMSNVLRAMTKRFQ